MQNQISINRLNDYLNGIAHTNSDYAVLDICYVYEITEYDNSMEIDDVIDNHFMGEALEWKKHNCSVSLVTDGKAYMTNLCFDWFHKGLNNMLQDIDRERFHEFKEFALNRYSKSNNSVRIFCDMLFDFLGDSEVQVYEMNSKPDFYYELLWDDVLIVTENKKLIIHFGMTD